MYCHWCLREIYRAECGGWHHVHSARAWCEASIGTGHIYLAMPGEESE